MKDRLLEAEGANARAGPPQATERVLPTMNPDGSRRWLRPKPSQGAFWARRRIVAYALMAVFFLVPYLRMAGRPLMLLDLPRRQFTLFGTTFLSTDSMLFMLLMVSCLLAIFLLTAMFGRVWCGWGCPQTVYMEFLFRPLERWLEGGYNGSIRFDRRGGFQPRRLLKYALYAVLAAFLAHTFLAYFVGVEELAKWVRRSPVEHPVSFLVMLGTAAAIFFDFAIFREQTCLVACPYGRLQSALLDRQSLIVAYDARRGEPRQRGVVGRPESAGDCVDCGACVLTCPTGIDIRDGLQMECIHCTQCMDACDVIMDNVAKPRGLIRYGSRDRFEGRPGRLLRARVVLYPLVLAGTLGLLVWNLSARADTDVTLLRAGGAPFVREPDGTVVNQIMVKLTNRGSADRSYRLELLGTEGAHLIAPVNPVPVAAGAMRTLSVFVVLPPRRMPDDGMPVRFRVSDGLRYSGDFAYRLIGPDRESHPGEEGKE